MHLQSTNNSTGGAKDICCSLDDVDMVIIVSGSYMLSNVDHNEVMPGSGVYMLHQGIQRRIAITIMHEDGPDLKWRDIQEMVVGRIRNTLEWKEPDREHTGLSLNLLPAHYIKQQEDDR